MAVQGISMAGALVRVGLSVSLVLVTFNPSGYSVAHWLAAAPMGVTAGKTLALLTLAIGWVACLRAAFVALGWGGLALGGAFLGALLWWLIDLGLVSTAGSAIVWVSLVVIGVLLGVGLSWSLIRARATGQIEVQ
jgi:hypothetical protein